MFKKIFLTSATILVAGLAATACGPAGTTTQTTSTTAAVTTGQPPSSTSAATAATTPLTTIMETANTSTAPISTAVTSIPPATTVPLTSIVPTTSGVYIIRATLSGVDDLDAHVKAGTTVRWTPLGHEDRTLVSDIPGLFGGYLSSNPYVEYTFNTAGTFYYHFTELPGFRTSIVVTP